MGLTTAFIGLKSGGGGDAAWPGDPKFELQGEKCDCCSGCCAELAGEENEENLDTGGTIVALVLVSVGGRGGLAFERIV